MGTNRPGGKRQITGSDEWYTPQWLLGRITTFLGVGWFDPCAPSLGHAPRENGLAVSWHGRIFANPPYSRMGPWAAKFIGEEMDEGLLLVPAHTDTRWFAPLFDYPILFFRGRIAFVDVTGQVKKNPSFGNALVYRGPRASAFAMAFGDLGAVVMRASATTAQSRRDLWTQEVGA